MYELGVVLCSICSCYVLLWGENSVSAHLTMFSQEVKSKILNMTQLQADSEFQKLLKDCTSDRNCE